MDWTAWLACLAMILTGVFLVRHIGVNLSATSVLLCLLLLLHGPAYLYYTRVWGPETEFFENILSAAPGVDVIQYLDIALTTFFISICFGIKLIDVLTKTKGARIRLAINEWGTVPAQRNLKIELERLKFLVFVSIIFMLPFVFFDQQLSKVLVYFTSNLGEFEKIALRREGGGSSFYIYNLLMANVIPFVAFGFLTAHFFGLLRNSFASILFLMFIFLLVLSKAATLSKAPLIILMVQFAVVYFISRSLKTSLRLIAYIFSIAFSGFLVMAIVANSNMSELAELIDFLFYRVFMIVNEGLVEYFSAIPYVIDHNWNSLPGWMIGETKIASYWLVGEVHRGAWGSTTTVMFLGDAWADFSWMGVVFAPLVLAGMVRFLDVKLILHQGPGIFTIAALALAHNGIFVALNTSLQTAMLTGGLLFVLPLSFLLSARRRNINNSLDNELRHQKQFSN